MLFDSHGVPVICFLFLDIARFAVNKCTTLEAGPKISTVINKYDHK